MPLSWFYDTLYLYTVSPYLQRFLFLSLSTAWLAVCVASCILSFWYGFLFLTIITCIYLLCVFIFNFFLFPGSIHLQNAAVCYNGRQLPSSSSSSSFTIWFLDQFLADGFQYIKKKLNMATK